MDAGPSRADLHVHTTASDGTLTIDRLPAAAAAGGVDLVAVTDHDVIHPELPAPVVSIDGIVVVRSIELRVQTPVQQLDLLGYAVRPTDDLVAELDRIQRDRIDRGTRIINAVENRLDIELGIEPRAGIGRPHIARAIADSDAPYDFDGAFDELIGNDGPCYVARDVTPFDRGVKLLANACAFVSLAHPFRYPDPAAALSRLDSLDAVERYYPYGFDVDTDRLEAAIDRDELLVTGGSDAHGDQLGLVSIDGDTVTAVRELLPRAQPYTSSGS